MGGKMIVEGGRVGVPPEAKVGLDGEEGQWLERDGFLIKDFTGERIGFPSGYISQIVGCHSDREGHQVKTVVIFDPDRIGLRLLRLVGPEVWQKGAELQKQGYEFQTSRTKVEIWIKRC